MPAGQVVERERRHRPRALERARRVDPEELELARDVADTLVRRRLAAAVERPDDDLVADREAVDAGAELRDRPGHLVPDHLRRLHAVVHRAVGDVDVGAADPAVGDVEPDLALIGRARLRTRRPRTARRPRSRRPSLFASLRRRQSVSAASAASPIVSPLSSTRRSQYSPSERWIRSAALARSAFPVRRAT